MTGRPLSHSERGLLEGNSEPQPNRATAVDSFLRKGVDQTSEVWIRSYVMNHWFEGCWIDGDVEVAKECERSAATTVITIRREQPMVEDVVDVGSECSRDSFAEVEVFVDTEVHTPRARASQTVALRHLRIVEHIGADRRQVECGRIPNLISHMVVHVADHRGSERGFGVEIASCVNRSNSDVARREREAVVTEPEGSKTCSRLREHVERRLPATEDRIGQGRERGAKLTTTTNGQIVHAVGDETILRNKSFVTVIMVRLKWVVSDSTQARVARVQAARFLVHVCVGDVEHQPLGVATLQLSLERIGTSMSEVSVAEEEVSQARERLTSLVCRRQIAVAFIDRIARCESISGSGRAEWDITRWKCVQISSCDESAERATQVRNAQR